MSVNKIKIIRPTTDNYVDIPIEMKWDFGGHDDSILEYQKDIVEEIIGSPNDFEVSRFSHNSDIDGNTDINYEFYFYDNVSPITATTVTQTNWGISYINEGFTNEVDSTWGKWTIQEGEENLYVINRRTGKKYKFLLEEV